MEENKEIKKSKKNKVIVIVLSLVIILLLAVGVYFLFIKKDDNNLKPIEMEFVTYKENGKKEIRLKKNEDTSRCSYQLINGDKEYIAYSDNCQGYNDYLNVYTENSFYLLNNDSKEILAYYENDKPISFSIIADENLTNQKTEWYEVYTYEEDDDKRKIVMIANSKIGEIFKYNDIKLDSFVLNNNYMYLQFGNKIEKYNENGENVVTKKYDKVLLYREIYVGYKDGNYYSLQSLDDEIKLEKMGTYKSNTSNKSLEIYTVKKSASEDEENQYLLVYDAKYLESWIDIYSSQDGSESKVDNYYDITYSALDWHGKDPAGSFLINIKTNELIDFAIGSYHSIYKVSNGYFFVQHKISESIDIPGDAMFLTDKVITSTGKELEGNGMYFIVNNDIIVQNSNSLIKYDIKGNIVLNKKYDVVYECGYNTGYILSKLNGVYYVVKVDSNFSQKEIEAIGLFDPDKSYIDRITDKEIQFRRQDTDEAYTYDYISKKIIKN